MTCLWLTFSRLRFLDNPEKTQQAYHKLKFIPPVNKRHCREVALNSEIRAEVPD